jgi:hypothetical protein
VRRGAGRLKALVRPPYRNALVIIGIVVVMGVLFCASYSLVLGRATPHRIGIGLVGRPAERPALVGALELAAGGGLVFRPYPSAQAARTAINQQAEYGALVLGPGPPRLLVSSASGASVARVLEQAAARTSLALGEPIPVANLHPLPPGDPSGLAEFYATLAATVVGFITMFQLRALVPGITLGGWCALIAVLAVIGGLALALVVELVISALPGPFPELWYGLGVEIAVAALISSALIVLIGRWAIIPTWLLLIVLGNTSAGGAVAPPLLPPVYAFIGRFLPPGATVDILRTATYFRHYQHAVRRAGHLAGLRTRRAADQRGVARTTARAPCPVAASRWPGSCGGVSHG